jgi:hypothetical protein
MHFGQVMMTMLGCVLASGIANADECYGRAGWIADPSTVSHGVDGTVRILDNQTLRVENFDYDGGTVDLDNYAGISVWCVAAGVSFGSGSFQAPAGPTLTLSSLPATVSTGDPLTFASCGGLPGSLLLFLVIDFNGTPLFQPVLIGSHDAAGEWCLTAPVPAGVGPLDVQFQVLGFVSAGTLVFSNPGEVQFL